MVAISNLGYAREQLVEKLADSNKISIRTPQNRSTAAVCKKLARIETIKRPQRKLNYEL